MFPHGPRGAGLVLAHEARVADNVDCHDRGEPADFGHSAPREGTTLAQGDAVGMSAARRLDLSTKPSVGHTGDEHLSLLIGHPVAVMRCRLRLEVKEPIHPELLNTVSVGVRLGAVPDFQDGLLGYFVNDDYTRLYCADAAIAGFARQVGPGRGFLQQANLVPDFYQTFSNDLGATVTEGASPVTHPYVDTSGVLAIQPNQEIALTLLVEPQTVVHATAGPAAVEGHRHAAQLGGRGAGGAFSDLPLRTGAGRSAEDPHAGTDRRHSRQLELGPSLQHHRLGRGPGGECDPGRTTQSRSHRRQRRMAAPETCRAGSSGSRHGQQPGAGVGDLCHVTTSRVTQNGWSSTETTAIPRVSPSSDLWRQGMLDFAQLDVDASVLWIPIGPAPLIIDAQQNLQGNGPNSGEVTDIAIDPNGTADNVIYISTNDGGIWKTEDGGTTWTQNMDDLLSLSMGAVAIDASSPAIQRVIYAGTGNMYDGGEGLQQRHRHLPFARRRLHLEHRGRRSVRHRFRRPVHQRHRGDCR